MSARSPLSPRTVVVGSSCAGKSTFARALAEARGCALIELDELYWSGGWKPKPQAEFLRLVQQAAEGETWVAAGNYSLAREALWSRATTIVWLDLNLPTVFWRGLRRTVARAASGQDLFHGNRESFRRSFLSRESILWWILSTHARRRREFEALLESGDFAQLGWYRARNAAQAAAILHRLRTGG